MSLLLDTPVPASDRLDGRTVVMLHAHPDDEAIFTGATIRRLADRGARVVLVTATAGEMGTPRAPVRDLAATRRAELEQAAEVLGVARLVLLGRRDSGLPGWESGSHARALVRSDLQALSRTLAALAEAERAEAVVAYDADGIYGHPDHVAVHLVGRHAAALAGVTSYEATVDREHLHFAGAHLLDDAVQPTERRTYGRVTAEITTAVAATPSELAAKRAAMLAHASQIGPEALDGPEFAETYELEWFVRRGQPALLETLGNAHAAAW
ncbi:MAG: LmbE family protein [Frankiales bacterium]|jgi:LmbE family N-acetylglucosaminyl deacetylase|nr:LmbE family protein [Frankiales bacterium]